jgi:LuxR family maltose regulon positive regulatory protein
MMTEVRHHDLRLTGVQTGRLVSAKAGVRLTQGDAADLTERTEGWPAAVYLAALSLRGHPWPSAFVRRFTGNNRFIVDFLAEEVLSRQPAAVRRFLAQTSILNRFCAPLCDAVTGGRDAAEKIRLLERENLFLEPLDDDRRWYRYHRLFAQLLRSQLARTEPAGVPALHRRASDWHQRHGTVPEAIHHALAAGDTDVAAGLITRHWPALAGSRGAVRMRGWLRALGHDHVAQRPVLAHCAAWVAALSGDLAAARRWLPAIEEGKHDGRLPDGMHSLQFSAALLHGVFGFGGLAVMRQAAGRAVEFETDPASPWYAMARAALGYSHYLSGDLAAAWEPLQQAARGRAAAPVLRAFALSVLSLIAVEQGRPAQAGELIRAAHGLLDDTRLGHRSVRPLARVATGAVYAAQRRLDDARAEAEAARRSLSGTTGCAPWIGFEATLLLARIYLELGDRAGAAELAEEAGAVLDAMPGCAGALRARLSDVERQLAAAARPAGIESLTGRERSVLRLLASTLSLREIGQEMSVTQNTVKSHTRSIYRKLGVTGRRGAVARSRELHLP